MDYITEPIAIYEDEREATQTKHECNRNSLVLTLQ